MTLRIETGEQAMRKSAGEVLDLFRHADPQQLLDESKQGFLMEELRLFFPEQILAAALPIYGGDFKTHFFRTIIEEQRPKGVVGVFTIDTYFMLSDSQIPLELDADGRSLIHVDFSETLELEGGATPIQTIGMERRYSTHPLSNHSSFGGNLPLIQRVSDLLEQQRKFLSAIQSGARVLELSVTA